MLPPPGQATDIPTSFFEIACMDDTSATIVLLTDCPWDIVLGLAGRDVEDDLQLTGKILRLCLQNKEVSVERHLVEARRVPRVVTHGP